MIARISHMFGFWRRRREAQIFEEARHLASMRLEQYFADRTTRALPVYSDLLVWASTGPASTYPVTRLCDEARPPRQGPVCGGNACTRTA